MNNVFAFFKLIRFPNLLILVITQLVTSLYFISRIDNLTIITVSLATVLIAAGGYVLNDIEDIGIDLINKPKKISFNISVLKKIYLTLSFLGLVLAFYVSSKYSPSIFKFFLLAFFLLFFYSKFLSKFKIIGNILISFLIAYSIFIVFIFESDTSKVNLKYFYQPSIYMFFAFLMNWIREIIKDVEDRLGDEKLGRKSLAIVFGVGLTKKIVIIQLIFLSFLILIQLVFFKYVLLAPVFFMNFYLIYRIYISKNELDFKQISFLIKTSMALGILYPIFHF